MLRHRRSSINHEAPAEHESRRPPLRNALLVTADQWRGDCLSALGHCVQTPHLDALVAEAVLFKRHFANTAPCGPSRASLHTGTVQRRHGVVANDVGLSANLTNWAIEARRGGHEPALFGYTDTLSEDQVREPRAVDLSVSDGVLPGLDPAVLLGKAIRRPTPWVDWLRTKGWQVADPARLYTTRDSRSGDRPAPLAVPPELHDTRFLVDSAIDYIERQAAERSALHGWCVHLSLLRPHPPWIPPAPYHSMYPQDELPAPEQAGDADEQAATHPWLAAMLANPHARAPDEGRRRRWQAAYYGLMTEVDDNLGRLFAALKRLGMWDETLIVFTSDHGEQMGDQHLIGKLGFFDASYSVPLIIRDPRPEADASRGGSVTAFTESIDLAPTLLDWLGIDIPEQFDGASLLPFTADRRPGAGWRSEAHWEFHFGSFDLGLGLAPNASGMTVLRGEDYRCIAFDAAELPTLYQTAADTCRNLAGDPGYAKRVGDAQERIVAWQRSHVPATSAPGQDSTGVP